MKANSYKEWASDFPKFGEFWYAIYDNFLPQEAFDDLEHYLGGNTDFPWFFSKGISGPDPDETEGVYWATTVYDTARTAERNEWNPLVTNLKPFYPLLARMNVASMLRIKTNHYQKTYKNEIQIHGTHVDYKFEHRGALFFLTDWNAPTFLEDGTAVQSKKNRMMFFNSARAHSSSAPTDAMYRQTINFNFFPNGTYNFLNPDNPDTKSIKLTASENVTWKDGDKFDWERSLP